MKAATDPHVSTLGLRTARHLLKAHDRFMACRRKAKAKELGQPGKVFPRTDQQATTGYEPARVHDSRWCSVRRANILPGPDGVCPACGTRVGV
jgi:hypothetical protein